MRPPRLPDPLDSVAAVRRKIPLLDDDTAWGEPRCLSGPDLWAELGRSGCAPDDGARRWGERV